MSDIEASGNGGGAKLLRRLNPVEREGGGPSGGQEERLLCLRKVPEARRIQMLRQVQSRAEGFLRQRSVGGEQVHLEGARTRLGSHHRFDQGTDRRHRQPLRRQV